jgi:hypothetical protein
VQPPSVLKTAHIFTFQTLGKQNITDFQKSLINYHYATGTHAWEVYSTPCLRQHGSFRFGSVMMVIKRAISYGHAIRGF